MDKKERNSILDNSDIANLIAQNKNVNFIRQTITEQSKHKLSYSIIRKFISENLKKTWINVNGDKKWVDINDEVTQIKPPDNSVTKSEEPPGNSELTLYEIDRKLLAASHNLDSLTKEEIINFLQTIMKNNYTTLSKINNLEKRFRRIELKNKKNK